MKSIALIAALTFCLIGCSQPAADTATGSTTAATTEATTETTPVATVGADNVIRNAEGKAYCVVMKTPVTMAEVDAPKAEHEGVTYYFCCESCPSMFKKDPAKYAVAKK